MSGYSIYQYLLEEVTSSGGEKEETRQEGGGGRRKVYSQQIQCKMRTLSASALH